MALRPNTSFFVAVILTFLGISQAQGQLLNPGFETGNFTGWNTIGTTSVVGIYGAGPKVTPASGSFQALIQTDKPGSVTPAALEAWLGITPGSILALDPASAPVTQGSAIKQTITVTAGTTLTVRYNFMTNEANPNITHNDLFFFSVTGPGATLLKVANTGSTPFVPAPPGYITMTGYRTFSYTFPASGVVTVGFGVVDRGDNLLPSAILLDVAGGASGAASAPSSSGEGDFIASSPPQGTPPPPANEGGFFGFGAGSFAVAGTNNGNAGSSGPASSADGTPNGNQRLGQTLMGPYVQNAAGEKTLVNLPPGPENIPPGGDMTVCNVSSRLSSWQLALQKQAESSGATYWVCVILISVSALGAIVVIKKIW